MKDKKSIEDRLKRFSIKSPPEGLRSKILDAALREKRNSRVVTPGLWRLLWVSAVSIVIALFLDPDMIRWPSHQEHSPEILTEYHEILGDPGDGFVISKLQKQLLKKQSEAVFDITKFTKENFNEN